MHGQFKTSTRIAEKYDFSSNVWHYPSNLLARYNWIMREAFVSRIGSPLNLDQTHYDDSGAAEKIFRDISATDRETFASRNYFVGDETIDIGTSKFGDIYHVTELYVYAPQTTFKTSTTEVVNFPQLVDFDYAYSKSYAFNSLQFLCGLEEVGFASSDLSLGDEFYIERPEQYVGGYTLLCMSFEYSDRIAPRRLLCLGKSFKLYKPVQRKRMDGKISHIRF